jgi:hypothetical protein
VAQLALFFACIAGVYLILRFGDVVPPAGRIAINVAVVVGAVALARHWQRTGRMRRPGFSFAEKLPAPLKFVLAAALVIGLLFPVLLVLYFVRLGGQLWR